jgi:hypothetical protein
LISLRSHVVKLYRRSLPCGRHDGIVRFDFLEKEQMIAALGTGYFVAR